MTSKTILLTGVTGFVGRHLFSALSKTDHRVICLVRSAEKIQETFDAQVIETKDVSWKEKVKSCQPEIVIHLASFVTSADDEKAIDLLIESNLSFGTHLLDALKDCQVKCFINTGTFAEYLNNSATPDPAYLYSATKTAFKSILAYYAAIYKMKVIHMVPYTIYGGIDTKKKLIDFIYDSLDADQSVNMSPGEQLLDFIHINDVVNCYLAAIDNYSELTSEFIEIPVGTGVTHSPRQLAKLIEEKTGRKTNINWGGLSYRLRDTMIASAPFSPGAEKIGWKAMTSLKEGVEKYVQTRTNKNQ